MTVMTICRCGWKKAQVFSLAVGVTAVNDEMNLLAYSCFTDIHSQHDHLG